MNAGELRNKVMIQNKTVVRNTYGEEILRWANEAIVWAKIEPLTGREYWQSKQIQSSMTHKITIRYRRKLRSDARLVWGTQTPGVVRFGNGIKFGTGIKFGSPGNNLNTNPRIFNILNVIDPEEKHKELILMCSEWVT